MSRAHEQCCAIAHCDGRALRSWIPGDQSCVEVRDGQLAPARRVRLVQHVATCTERVVKERNGERVEKRSRKSTCCWSAEIVPSADVLSSCFWYCICRSLICCVSL